MIEVASMKRLAKEGAGVKRPKKRSKPKRPIGTKFINFTCELDTDNCVKEMGCALPTKHLQIIRKSGTWSIPLMPS